MNQPDKLMLNQLLNRPLLIYRQLGKLLALLLMLMVLVLAMPLPLPP